MRLTSAEYPFINGIPKITSAVISAMITSTGQYLPHIVKVTRASPCTLTEALFMPHKYTDVGLTLTHFSIERHLLFKIFAELPVSTRHLSTWFSRLALMYGRLESVELLTDNWCVSAEWSGKWSETE